MFFINKMHYNNIDLSMTSTMLLISKVLFVAPIIFLRSQTLLPIAYSKEGIHFWKWIFSLFNWMLHLYNGMILGIMWNYFKIAIKIWSCKQEMLISPHSKSREHTLGVGHFPLGLNKSFQLHLLSSKPYSISPIFHLLSSFPVLVLFLLLLQNTPGVVTTTEVYLAHHSEH